MTREQFIKYLICPRKVRRVRMADKEPINIPVSVAVPIIKELHACETKKIEITTSAKGLKNGTCIKN